MTTKHTPGPWHWAHSDFLKPEAISPAGIETILEFDGGRVDRDCNIEAMQAEFDANKRLIAAAPELLAALRAIVDEIEGPDQPYSSDSYLPERFLRLARTAVAKAEGA